ncbi:hypothetical protein ACFV0C_00815 [Streptomyces sp. NPDC059568]
MEISKSQVAAQSSAQESDKTGVTTDVADLIEPSAVVRSEDTEQDECYTF